MRRVRKNRKGTKRTDLANIKEALRDDRRWTLFGIVRDSDDGGAHFELSDQDLLVDVEIMPSQERLTCRVAFSAGGPGWGVWSIPPVGAEVVVIVPDGEEDFQPTVVATYSSNNMPDDIEEGRIVISCAPGSEVYIHDGTGDVDSLVKKSEYDALKNELDGHTHAYVPSGTGTAALTSAPTLSPTGTPVALMPEATGTTVLKAK